jgi:deazaflavin-dependent oxidoreductase (nitroreductase family)
MIRALRPYLMRAPGYVLLTTRGRRSGLPREVLLPCARIGESVVVLSTYGWRSNWIRNLLAEPEVEVTCNGRPVRGRAEVVDDPARKRELVTAEPFFLAVPYVIICGALWTLLRPLAAALVRRWVAGRPIVVIRPIDDSPAADC